MTYDELTKTIHAEEGKIFHRIGSDEFKDLFGPNVKLGYSYYINGERVDPPHLDVPSDFEEIDEPNWDEQPVDPIPDSSFEQIPYSSFEQIPYSLSNE